MRSFLPIDELLNEAAHRVHCTSRKVQTYFVSLWTSLTFAEECWLLCVGPSLHLQDHSTGPLRRAHHIGKPGAMAKVPAGEREKLQQAFAAFDSDGSGALSVNELANILSIGGRLSEENALKEAADIITKYDTDGNGMLDVSP